MAKETNRERSTIEVTTRKIKCNLEGHPLVYYTIGNTNEIRCDYCNVKYVYRTSAEDCGNTIP